MLVLLVIFMVTAPILQQGVNINLPKVKAAALTGEEQQLVVAVNRQGEVYLNDTPIDVARAGPQAAGDPASCARIGRCFCAPIRTSSTATSCG